MAVAQNHSTPCLQDSIEKETQASQIKKEMTEALAQINSVIYSLFRATGRKKSSLTNIQDKFEAEFMNEIFKTKKKPSITL